MEEVITYIFISVFFIFLLYDIVNMIKYKKTNDEQQKESLSLKIRLTRKLILAVILLFIFTINMDSCNKTTTKIHTDDIEFNELTGEPIYNDSYYKRFNGN